MNIDVTNTQSGGLEPVSKPEDYKANIRPPKEEAVQPVIEPTVPVAPIAETQVAPQEEQTPPVTAIEKEPVTPPSPIINTSGPRNELQEEEDYTPFEIPTPINQDEIDAVDFSSFDDGSDEDYVKTDNITPIDAEEDDDAFSTMDLAPESEKPDSQPTNIVIPQPTPLVNIYDEVKPPTEPVIPATPIDGAVNTDLPDGSKHIGYVKGNQPNGFGTSISKKGVKTTGVFKDGTLVAKLPAQEVENGADENEVDKNKPFKAVKVGEGIKKTATEDSGFNTWKSMHKINTEKTDEILSKGNLNLNEELEQESLKIKTTLNSFSSILANGKGQAVIAGKAKLTTKEKIQLQQAIESQYGKGNEAIDKVVNSQYGGINLVQKKDYAQMTSKQVVESVWKTAGNLHKRYDEITKPKKTATLQEEYDASIKGELNRISRVYRQRGKGSNNDINGLEKGKQYYNELAFATELMSSPKYAEDIYKQMTIGDKKIEPTQLISIETDAFNSWVREENIDISSVKKEDYARRKFHNEYLGSIYRIHNKIVRDVVEKNTTNKSLYGFTARQKQIELDNVKIGKERAIAVNKVTNEVLPKYIIQKQEFENKFKQDFDRDFNKLKADMSKTYQSAIKAVTESNPNAKAIIDEYHQKAIATDDPQERQRLSAEMGSKLSAFPEIAKLNKEFEVESRNKQRELDLQYQKKLVDFSVEVKRNAKKE